MKCVLRARGQLQRGFEVLALGEMCFQGMGAGEKGGLRCWHWVKRVFGAWWQVKRGFHMLVLGEMCFAGMGADEKGL